MREKVNNIPAVILARGGSKGILHKNLQEIDGETLVYRCAREAVASKFDPVYVYSDSASIRDEGVHAGAIPVERPEDVSEDDTTSEATINSFLDEVDPDNHFGALCLLQCTTPFLMAEHMNLAYDKFCRSDFDSVITVTKMIKFLGYEKFNKHSEFVPMCPHRKLRQAFNWGQWLENGGLYLATVDLWRKHKRIGEMCGVIPMAWWESMEIDDPIDLDVARALAEIFSGAKNGCCNS